ncbi:MAG: thioredoxin family protein [Bacteroidetes bacterium]|nr:thioredoxin family protein [Bacteroidota bacterium]
MKTTFFSILFFLSSIFIFAQETYKPYNENADIRADLKKAVQTAKEQHKHVLIQWGGNWCPWCIRFHKLASSEHQIDSIIKKDYVFVLANVPREKSKRDMGLYGEYGYPNRFGFPVFVVLDGNGKQLHIQDSGLLEYAKAPGYDTSKVVNFLKMWNVKAVDPASYTGK